MTIVANLNIEISCVLTKVGKEQFARSYNKDLPEIYHKRFEDIKEPLTTHLWELIYFFGDSGFSDDIFAKSFEGGKFIITEWLNGAKKETVVYANTNVSVKWTENGKLVVTAVENEEVYDGFEGKSFEEYEKKMNLTFGKFAYLIRNECFNGNTRMPLTESNSVTFMI